MALLDIPSVEETITDKANKIRAKLANVISTAEIRLQEIRNLVGKYGRATIATELGGDAAALLIVYNNLKAAIEAAKNVVVEELP